MGHHHFLFSVDSTIILQLYYIIHSERSYLLMHPEMYARWLIQSVTDRERWQNCQPTATSEITPQAIPRRTSDTGGSRVNYQRRHITHPTVVYWFIKFMSGISNVRIYQGRTCAHQIVNLRNHEYSICKSSERQAACCTMIAMIC